MPEINIPIRIRSVYTVDPVGDRRGLPEIAKPMAGDREESARRKWTQERMFSVAAIRYIKPHLLRASLFESLNLSARESTFRSYEAVRYLHRLHRIGLHFGQHATGYLRWAHLRTDCNRGSGVRRGAGEPAAHPEPARDLRPSVLAVQVADHQPHRLCGQMPGATSPRWSLSRRHLHLQELGLVLALESSDLGQSNPHGSLALAIIRCPRILTTLVNVAL